MQNEKVSHTPIKKSTLHNLMIETVQVLRVLKP